MNLMAVGQQTQHSTRNTDRGDEGNAKLICGKKNSLDYFAAIRYELGELTTFAWN